VPAGRYLCKRVTVCFVITFFYGCDNKHYNSLFAAEKKGFGKRSGPERHYFGSYNLAEVKMKICSRKRVLAILICLCSALLTDAAMLAAQTATRHPAKPTSAKGAQAAAKAASKTIDAILDQYVTAVGGIDAWKKSTTRVVKGSVAFSPSHTTGKVELYQAAPDKMRFEMKVPSRGVAWVLVNGGEGWQKDFASDPRRLDGKELADAKIDADFYKEVDLRRLYPRMEYGGASVIDSQPVEIVRGFTADGSSHIFYFAKSTGLLVREDFLSARGSEAVQTFFDDYRELKESGIKYKYQVKQDTGRAGQTMRSEAVLQTVPVDKSLFAPPAQ